MPDTIAERVSLELTRRGRILELRDTEEAKDGRPARYHYMVLFVDGGKYQAGSSHKMNRGDDCVLRRYQVRPPIGSVARRLAPWITLLPLDAAEVLPPEKYGRPTNPPPQRS
jgi:hypothetical protein